jgi:hypothetical protein
MKTIKHLAIFLLSVFIISCGKDENSTAEELRELDPNKVTEWIRIEAAIINSGNFPTPTTNAPSIIAVDKISTGILGVGFNTKFYSEGNYNKAYFRVKGANKYLELPIKVNTNSRKSKEYNSNNRITEEETGTEVDLFIGLDNEATVGKFCYEICFFNDEGQISNIEEICVTYNKPGGNENIFGEWQYYLNQVYDNTNTIVESDTFKINDVLYTDYCYGIDNMYSVISNLWIKIENIGNYEFNYKRDVIKDTPDCEVLEYLQNDSTFYNQSVSHNKLIGKWSYNKETNRFVSANQRNFIKFNTPEQISYDFEVPEFFHGELIFTSKDKFILKVFDKDGYYSIITYLKK